MTILHKMKVLIKLMILDDSGGIKMDRAKDKERDMQELSIKRLKWQGHGGMTRQNKSLGHQRQTF